MSKNNPSGIEPLEFKVLVTPLDVEQKTSGGIILPETTQDKEQVAQMKGKIEAVSPFAFDYADWGDISKPKAGDTVIMARYSGITVKGKDGKDYRLINDKDIAAKIKE